ncbi:hypothetical protein RYH73_16120 [Olivibacter sp. CPCC 100613]|uniref:hypothetical protein n=1 Tax=Olivibacter sp. CPCC 100613 TaxID=3079931 RepID=UPI002FF7DCE5
MCSGRCVLMSKLKKEKEREDKNPELKLKDFQLISERIDFKLTKRPIVQAIKKAFFPETKTFYLSPSLGAVFHPPII